MIDGKQFGCLLDKVGVGGAVRQIQLDAVKKLVEEWPDIAAYHSDTNTITHVDGYKARLRHPIPAKYVGMGITPTGITVNLLVH